MQIVMEASRRTRDEEREGRERLRYRVLEHLYALTDADPAAGVRSGELEEELGLSLEGISSLTRDLVRLGYLGSCPRGSRLRVTERGIEFLRAQAWRRRSIRN